MFRHVVSGTSRLVSLNVLLTTLCTSAWYSGSVDANIARTEGVVGRHRDLAFLVNWKPFEMEKIWSDAISVALHVWPILCRDLRFQ